MTRHAIITAVLGAALSVAPAYGSGAAPSDDDQPERPAEKDLCLLYVSQCGTVVQSLQDKIYRLQEEIAKGKRVYTTQELQLLKQKLEEAHRRLDLFFDSR